ncbi:MAG: hypothetical protein ACREQI_13690 [Candidatus Binataceae bacterium]
MLQRLEWSQVSQLIPSGEPLGGRAQEAADRGRSGPLAHLVRWRAQW